MGAIWTRAEEAKKKGKKTKTYRDAAQRSVALFWDVSLWGVMFIIDRLPLAKDYPA